MVPSAENYVATDLEGGVNMEPADVAYQLTSQLIEKGYFYIGECTNNQELAEAVAKFFNDIFSNLYFGNEDEY